MTADRRKTQNWARGGAILVACLLQVACTGDDEPEPISPAPSPGAEIVCGVDAGAIERATGYRPDEWTGALSSVDGQGTGTCKAYSNEVDGEIFVVRMGGVDDAEAVAVRRRISGDEGTPPRMVFDPQTVDGAVWGADDIPGSRRGVAANAEIFWGGTHLHVYIAPAAAERRGADDLLNLTYQVIRTYDLERPEP